MPIPLPLGQPLINGNYYSFASIEARILTVPFVDFTSINYSSMLEPTDVYGTLPQKLGTTQGKQNAECSLELHAGAWEYLRRLLAPLGVGYGLVRFSIQVQFAESIVQPVITHTVFGARITKADFQNSEGSEATKVALTLNVMRVYEGGGLIDRIDLPRSGIAF